ncbi:MAG TPA: tetratricopeptide repeat protein [bacterium]
MQGRYVVVGIMLSAMLAGCATGRHARTGPYRKAYGAYLEGLMFERDLLLPEALKAYREALEYDSTSPYLRVRVGATLVKMGRQEEAMAAFRQALEIDPDHPDVLRWLAMLATSQGRLDDAIGYYERLLEVHGADRYVLSTLADLYVLHGNLPRAVELYEQLAREFGRSSQLHFNLGVLRGRMGQFPEAMDELSRALEISPDSMEIHVALGLTFELGGRPLEAARHYEAAIAQDPANARLYQHAARAHLSAGEPEEAKALYQELLKLMPHDLDVMMGLVRLWLMEENYAEAERFLAERMPESEFGAALSIALGIVRREAGQPEKALEAFERAAELEPENAQAHFYLATQQDRMGSRDRARASLRNVIALNPDHPDALNYLGYLDAEDGVNLQEAKSMIERALKLDPDNGAYVDSLGWVYYQLGDIEQALALLRRAAELMESDPTIVDHLGDAYYRNGDVEAARTQWRRALELGADEAALLRKLQQLEEQGVTGTTP